MIEIFLDIIQIAVLIGAFVSLIAITGVTVYSDIQKEKRRKEEHDHKYHHFD